MYALTGIVIWFGIFIGALLICDVTPLIMWDFPSVLIVAGFDLAALFVSGGIRDAGMGFRQLFMKNAVLTKKELMDAAAAFSLLSWCSVAGGILGFVMGLVLMLVNLSKPDTIGPFLAVALITVVYGLTLSILVFVPGKSRFARLASSM